MEKLRKAQLSSMAELNGLQQQLQPALEFVRALQRGDHDLPPLPVDTQEPRESRRERHREERSHNREATDPVIREAVDHLYCWSSGDSWI